MVIDKSSKAVAPSGDVYISSFWTNSFNFQRSQDAGRSWQDLPPSFQPQSCAAAQTGTLVCYGPGSASGATGFWRSQDHGVTWTISAAPRIAGAITSDGHTFYVSVATASSVGLARSDDDGVSFKPLADSPGYISAIQALSNGHLLVNGSMGSVSGTFRSKDQGQTWTPVAAGVGLPVADDGKGRLYAIRSRQVTSSSDEGDSWSWVPESPSLPDGSFLGIDGQGRLFAASSGKMPLPEVSMSEDAGAHWKTVARLPNPSVLQFATDKQGRLLAATSGGLYRFDDAP